jgi:ankyrin repeat protein
LLAKGVNINARDEDGNTPLLLASADGYTDMVEVLLKHWADVDAKNKYGWTALMWASTFGKKDVVEMLLQSKVWAAHQMVVSSNLCKRPRGVCFCFGFRS